MAIEGDDVQAIVDSITGGIDFSDPFAFLNQTGSSNNSLSGKAALQNAALARNKFLYQQEQDQAKLARELASQQAQIAALKNLYSAGQGNLEKTLGRISGIESTSKTGIENQLASSLAALNEGYQGTPEMLGAMPLTEQAYAGLEEYLAKPVTNYYGGIQTTAPQVQNELSALLQSQGAVSPDVQAYLQGVNASLAGGAQNFQNLLSTLAALETSGFESRKREAKTAGTMAKTNLAQQKAALEGRIRSEAASAISQLASQMALQRLQAENDAQAQQDALAKTLAELGIIVGGDTGTGGGSGGSAIEQIIREAGGTSTETEFEKALGELAAGLSGIGPGADFVPYK